MFLLLPLVVARVVAAPSFDVRFADTTVSFYDRRSPRAGDPPYVEDDRPCVANGVAWTAAEDAVIAAVPRRAGADPLAITHAPFAEWLDEHGAISERRPPRAHRIDTSVRITPTGGYLIQWGRDGVIVYCFDVRRAGARTVLVPRIIDETDF